MPYNLNYLCKYVSLEQLPLLIQNASFRPKTWPILPCPITVKASIGSALFSTKTREHGNSSLEFVNIRLLEIRYHNFTLKYSYAEYLAFATPAIFQNIYLAMTFWGHSLFKSASHSTKCSGWKCKGTSSIWPICRIKNFRSKTIQSTTLEKATIKQPRSCWRNMGSKKNKHERYVLNQHSVQIQCASLGLVILHSLLVHY